MSYADRDRYGIYKSSTSPGPGPALMGADTLIGDSVVNGQEEDLGDIKEIMLDMRTGQVAYAVLSFGGFLGMGEKLFAVPWQALELDTVNKRFVLNVNKERLQTAPGFNPDAWPDMSDVSWAVQIHSFYGTDPDTGSRIGGGGMSTGSMGASGLGAGAASMGAGMAGSSSGAGGAGSGMGGAMGGTSGTSGTSSGMGGATGGAGTSAGSGTTTGTGGTAAGTGSGVGGDLRSDTLNRKDDV